MESAGRHEIISTLQGWPVRCLSATQVEQADQQGWLLLGSLHVGVHRADSHQLFHFWDHSMSDTERIGQEVISTAMIPLPVNEPPEPPPSPLGVETAEDGQHERE